MMFDSFQPPYLPDNSTASSNASTQLSQNLTLPNTDVVTNKSGTNGRRSSQTPNILMADNEDQHRGLPASKDATSIITDANFLSDVPTKNADVGTGKLVRKSLKFSDDRSDNPAIVISLLDSPTPTNETQSVNDSHSNEHHQQTADDTITNATIDTSILTSSDTTADNFPNDSINQRSSDNPTAEKISGDLDLSMVVENPTDYEPTILGTLTPIRRKPLRVMRCEHEELAVLREVKKDNQNKGRKFFSCPRFETGEQCSYFRWEEAQYLPPRLPSHRPDYVPSRLLKSRENTLLATFSSSDRPFTSRSQTIPTPTREVSSVGTSVTERTQPNKQVEIQQEISTQKTKTSNNDLIELTAEDVDPSWFLSVIEEEQTRNASAKSKNNTNNRDNNNHNNNNGSNAIARKNSTTGNIPSADSSPSDTSQTNVHTTATDEPSQNSIPSSYESWSQVPIFSDKQLLDVVLNHVRTQEQYSAIYEVNMEKIRKERDQALDDLKKAHEQIASLKRELERSKLMTNILVSQKRLLEIENEQLEDSNNSLKRYKSSC